MNDLQLIRPAKAAQILGISIPTLYREMKEPDFPNKVRISKRAVGFRQSELIEWMEGRTETAKEA